MDKLKNIDKKLLESDKKYEAASVARLSNNDRQKLRASTSDESSYLILVLYIILILFVSLTLLIVIQGDKESPYKIHRKFKGDYKEKKELTIWDKIYYLFFGSHRVNKYESQCDHLSCKKVPYHSNSNNNGYDNNGKRRILSNNDKKYKYLESFNDNSNNNNDTNMYSNCDGSSYNNSNYISQFNSSRKCLTGSFNLNNNGKNNSKYSYLSHSDFEELD